MEQSLLRLSPTYLSPTQNLSPHQVGRLLRISAHQGARERLEDTGSSLARGGGRPPDACLGFKYRTKLGNEPICERRIGDSLSWKMDLPIAAMPLPRPTMSNSVLEYSAMSIDRTHGSNQGSPFDELVPFYAITAPTFVSPVLKYTDIFGNDASFG